MTAKGHCKFDASDQDSEFADFYNFSEQEHDDAESDAEGDEDEGTREEAATSSRADRKPLLADEDSICLPSGKITSKKSSTPAVPSLSQLRRRTQRTLNSQLEHTLEEADDDEERQDGSSKEGLDPDVRDTRLLSKREKREKATVTYQMTNMRANDRNSLMHLPASEQRSILAAQNRHMEKVQKEERRRRSKVDRKGNKNLYAYWATETPVYSCG
ncbi:hypothetical protein Daus18300_010050 [Diaporthe australafricana]|uniref:INO80 complex subunit B-like conserved region domain-containing protein n=1 Tax=Diaporthe australafricana TaxID=127596 RepID=A0ABR3WBS8_9PEZI